jgi:uncharacterized membrane protein YagU involved in acid resistance
VTWLNWLVWGFVATVMLTLLMAGSQGFGLTRMNIPYLLGTIVTPDRDRAKLIGIVMHLLNGWMFALAYVLAFNALGSAGVAFGAFLGLLHGLFVAGVALPALPGLHPRMASEQRGPTVVRQLEPPGFLGMNYGIRTPVSIVLAHVIYGAFLGGVYGLRL